MTTFSDGLAAYKICAQAEGKSQRTVGWISDIAGYFDELLGDPHIEAITAGDLGMFIIALQQRQTFSNHRLAKPQNRMLSPQSVATMQKQ